MNTEILLPGSILLLGEAQSLGEMAGRIDWMESVVIALVVNLIASLLYLLFLFSVRPKMEISELIAREERNLNGETRVLYQMKLLNKNRFSLINVQAELRLLRPRSARAKDKTRAVVWWTEELPLKRPSVLLLNRFSKTDKMALYAFRVSTEKNLKELLSKDDSAEEPPFIRLQVFATHSLSGFSTVIERKFTREDIQDGSFGHGTNMNVYPSAN